MDMQEKKSREPAQWQQAEPPPPVPVGGPDFHQNKHSNNPQGAPSNSCHHIGDWTKGYEPPRTRRSLSKSITISSTMATSLPSTNGRIDTTSEMPTLNESNMLMNSQFSGSPAAFAGAPAVAPEATPEAAPAAAPAPTVILVHNGAGSGLSPLAEGNVTHSVLPSTSDPVPQTSFPSMAVSSSATVLSSSSIRCVAPATALLRPAIQTAGPAAAPVAKANPNGGDSTMSVGSLPTAAASVASGGAGVSLQSSLVSSQPGPSMPGPAKVQVIKPKSPKTIVLVPFMPQNQARATSQSTAAGDQITGQTAPQSIPNPGGIPAPRTSTGMAEGTTKTLTQRLPGNATTIAGGIQTKLVQLPRDPTKITKILLPPGMALVQSENGQLLVLPQKIMSQKQAQIQKSKALSTNDSSVQMSTVKAPGKLIIATQVTPTTVITQMSQTQKTQPRVQPTPTSQPSCVAQSPVDLGGTNQNTASGTASAVQSGTLQKTGQQVTATTATPTQNLENVEKCKNFLSTLVKLCTAGKESTDTAAKVLELVKNLLAGKIEAEDFISKLYQDLHTSPQPYLLPFLKKTLPMLRQLTPDPATFIHQSQSQKPETQTLPAVVMSSTVQGMAGKTLATIMTTPRPPVISVTKPTLVSVSKQGQPTPQVIQQPQKPKALIRPPQGTLTPKPKVALPQPRNHIILTIPQQIQQNQLQTVPVIKPATLPGNKVPSFVLAQAAAAQNNKLKEPGGGSGRDDDDINAVASMAGVKLSEEHAKILATNSGLMDTLARSGNDETFLLSAPLQRRILEIGKESEITQLDPDVISYVSLATQQRLQILLEKASLAAQHRNLSYKDDERYEKASDVRAQLKIFEQLDRIKKQKKDEQEREILIQAAKSRSRQEDPEKLRLKQKAKEMQELEQAQKRQRDANLTALAAIGPRKKRKVDSLEPGSGTEGSGTSTTVLGRSGVGTITRQRMTRITLRDLIFCLQNDQATRHSLLLYKAFLQ
ncbi:transcription initiation factor TFIID subunit 4-like [Macrotis lagotis]|uniref:transcription initiation factor TFIID subunit 4-like n=1 Tax=Macrotis lagotis TaxID=92651 RepID=UPI003D68224E